MIKTNQIVLAQRPQGAVKLTDFRLEKVGLPPLEANQVLVETQYLSLDPYMRGRMSEAKSYAAPVAIGGVMTGEVVGEVSESKHPEFKPGDLVRAYSGWRSHAVLSPPAVRKIDSRVKKPSTAIGVLGMPGFTAYSGLMVIGQPKRGETVVVAAASGPVGSLVGQMAKLKGARAVGIAGGAEKCAYVVRECGFDVAIDRNDPHFDGKLKEACAKGIDVYFENVGGTIFEAVLPLLNKYSRIPLCGLIAQYESTNQGPSTNLLPTAMRTFLTQSVLVRGFINSEFEPEYYESFLSEMAPAVDSGKIRYKENIVDGLENAPKAFMDMLKGGNFGKVLVRVK